jgi:hypothetical protein
MDHAKNVLPRLQMCNKMISTLGQLFITLTSMIAHGHGDEKYAQYSNELWPNDPNFTIGYLLQLFCKGNCVVYVNYARWRKLLAPNLCQKICCFKWIIA